ncbi:MAG: Do family serine endopeptidase [Leptothrix sp. (in: b-proteobacteria)]
MLPACAQTAPARPTVSAVSGLPDFTTLVEQVGPAVVNIRTTQHAKADSEEAQQDAESRELFRRFFGVPAPRQLPRRAPQPDPEEEVQRGVGSGFIVSGDGYVLTNAHVVDGADEVLVRLTDKREFKARIIGVDKRSDVAVVKIDADKLPTVSFGDVSKLKVGEWVIAIGSPFSLDNSVTAGIVSAKARDTGELLPLIQTDVAINPGNSGGPLINLRGEVVGINSQIYSRSGGYMGISFAIPADEVQRVATQLRTHGRVIRSRIGVSIGEVTKDVAESLGLPKPTGALVRSAETDGPGAKAGIEGGDIILRFDDQVIEKWSDLPRFVTNTTPGSAHKLQLLRRGVVKELSVTVAEIAAEPTSAQAETPKPAPQDNRGLAFALGLKVSELSEADRSTLKLKTGVRIDAVDGAAARAGLREGDILLAVANSDVGSAKQLEVLLAHADRAKPLSVLFRREDLAQYAVIRLSK